MRKDWEKRRRGDQETRRRSDRNLGIWRFGDLGIGGFGIISVLTGFIFDMAFQGKVKEKGYSNPGDAIPGDCTEVFSNVFNHRATRG
jgi:hypothetical protein